MKTLLHTLLLLIAPFVGLCQSTPVTVYKSGTGGYKSFRIPAIIKLPNNDLLTFCEGRVANAGDFGNIDIVVKRSSDKGNTWSALQVVVDNDSLQAGNMCPVVDVSDPAYPNGRIFVFYSTGNRHEHEIKQGLGVKEVWYTTSTDNGITWSKSVNITQHVHRPNKPDVNAAYNFSEAWRYFAPNPGHATQIPSGKYKGRIFVTAAHSSGEPDNNNEYDVHGFYTDDHGKTFHLGASLNFPGSNESIVAELSNDRLMMNSRNQKGDVRARIVSVSSDGGATWDTTYFDKNLPDPVCQGTLLTIGKSKGNNILAFCNPADTERRNNLTLRISYDDGKTWKDKYLIAKDPNPDKDNQRDYSAYSDIVNIDKRNVGILYEAGDYSEIVFTVVRWN